MALTSALGIAGCSAGHDTPCYPAGRAYTAVLSQTGRSRPLDTADVAGHRDGSFRAKIRIPASASPGESALSVQGSRFDSLCNDTASCASYRIRLTVLAARD